MKHVRTGRFIVLILTGLLLSETASAANQGVLALTLQHAPAGPSDGRLVIKLDAEGGWSIIETNSVPYRFQLNASWNTVYIDTSEDMPHRLQFRPGGYSYEGNFITCGNLPTCYDHHWMAPPTEGTTYQTAHVPQDVLFTDDGIYVDALGQCYSKRKQLLNQGKSLNWVLSNDHTVEKSVFVHFFIWGQDTQVSKEFNVPLTVLCKGDPAIADAVSPLPQIPLPMSVGFQVTSANLVVAPKQYEGECPKEISFFGKFTATEAGTFKYRLATAHGKVTHTRTVSITETQNGVYTLDDTIKTDVPLHEIPSPPPPGGSHGGPASGDMAAAQRPVDPIDTGPSSPALPTQLTDTPVPGNVHKESFRIEVLEPNSLQSNFDGFNITCAPKTNIATVGDLAGSSRSEPVAAPVFGGKVMARSAQPENKPADTKVVQGLVNPQGKKTAPGATPSLGAQEPAGRGSKKLDTDGLVGPKTTEPVTRSKFGGQNPARSARITAPALMGTGKPANTGGGSSRDTVQTEMISMDLRGDAPPAPTDQMAARRGTVPRGGQPEAGAKTGASESRPTNPQLAAVDPNAVKRMTPTAKPRRAGPAKVVISKLAQSGRSNIDVWIQNTGKGPASACLAEATLTRGGRKAVKTANAGTVAPGTTKKVTIATGAALSAVKVSVRAQCQGGQIKSAVKHWGDPHVDEQLRRKN